MSRLSGVESVQETSFSNSIERSVGAADATLQHLASAKETFGDLEAAYRTFKHELEIVKTEHAAQVSKFSILLLTVKRSKIKHAKANFVGLSLLFTGWQNVSNLISF